MQLTARCISVVCVPVAMLATLSVANDRSLDCNELSLLCTLWVCLQADGFFDRWVHYWLDVAINHPICIFSKLIRKRLNLFYQKQNTLWPSKNNFEEHKLFIFLYYFCVGVRWTFFFFFCLDNSVCWTTSLKKELSIKNINLFGSHGKLLIIWLSRVNVCTIY